jgi:hypothetical protein
MVGRFNNMRHQPMLHACFRTSVVLLLCTSALVPLPLRGQDPPVVDQEARAVFRISRKFMNDVAEKVEIVVDVPLSARVLTFHCTGMIHGRGKATIDLLGGGHQTVFVANSRGEGTVCVTAERRVFVGQSPVWAPFTACTLIRFDGRRCTRISTTPHAQVEAELEKITTHRDGFVGRAAGRMALPAGRLLLPAAERQGVPIADSIVRGVVDETIDKIVARLNERLPVEDSVNRLYPETKNWIFQVSKNAEFMQAAYGPPDARVPVLPPHPQPLANVDLEVWLHSSGKEAKFLENLSKQPLAHQLLQAYLEATLPKLAVLADDRSVVAAGPWVVISVGSRTPK